MYPERSFTNEISTIFDSCSLYDESVNHFEAFVGFQPEKEILVTHGVEKVSGSHVTQSDLDFEVLNQTLASIILDS